MRRDVKMSNRSEKHLGDWAVILYLIGIDYELIRLQLNISVRPKILFYITEMQICDIYYKYKGK